MTPNPYERDEGGNVPDDDEDAPQANPLDVYRIVLYVPTLNGATKQDIVNRCEGVEFATVGEVTKRTIPNYTDEHPTNITAKSKKAYESLFAVVEVPLVNPGRERCPYCGTKWTNCCSEMRASARAADCL